MKAVLRFAAAALMLAASLAGHAERGDERIPPLPALPSAQVIVKFKAGAALLRERALAARADPATTAQVLQQRASALGLRHGLALAAGPALSDRVQALSAPGLPAAALAARLAADPDVEYAEVSQRMRRLAVPNDPLFAAATGSGPSVGQWYLRAPDATVKSSIDAVGAWDLGKGSASVVVAVLDTGVRGNHPDLQGKLLPGYDMVSDATIANDGDGRDADPSDPGDWVSAAEANQGTFDSCPASSSSWHGTQVSGLIGAATDNGVGMAAAGWHTRVLPVRVLGKCYGNSADIQAGMRWAAGLPVPGLPANPNPARVINLSLGSPGSCGKDYQDTIAELNAAGVVVVVAAGNSAGLAVGTPGNCPGVVAVAALRHVGSKVGYSDVGPELAIAAPGGNCVNLGAGEPCLYPLLTTVDNGSTTPGSPTYTDSYRASVGTSFAAPLVSASAALLLAMKPELSPAEVAALLKSTARAFPTSGASAGTLACHAPDGNEQLECYCTTSTCGAGMLDTAALLRAVAPPPAAEPAPLATPGADAGGGGGGGGVAAPWALGLLVAAAVLRRGRRTRLEGENA